MNTTSKWLKTMVTSLLVTVALVLPMSTVGDDSTLPVLGFEGVEMNVYDDGSVQVLFDVYVSNTTYGDGAFFTLEYNEDYLTPSDIYTNVKITGTGSDYIPTDGFFQPAEELYEGENPFKYEFESYEGIAYGLPEYYASCDLSENTVSMFLVIDHARIRDEKGRDYENDTLDNVPYGEPNTVTGIPDDVAFLYSAGRDEKVVLGQLSFQVTDPAKLPEIIRYFSDVVNKKDPVVSDREGNDLILIDLKDGVQPDSGTRTDWGVAGYAASSGSGEDTGLQQWFYSNAKNEVTSRFTFKFPKTVISVRAAESELTINAYQAYTYGDMGDLAIALGKYSPMVTVTYADGTKENHVFQWDRDVLDEYTPINKATGDEVTDTNYARTGGEYCITQKYVYKDELGDSVAFPVPVDVHMTVTPITLLDVIATDLTKTYALSEVLEKVETGGDLDLPEYARLVTDVVPGGVSMVMEISGWKPVDGTWPVATSTVTPANTLMNSIKGVGTLATSIKPIYWPDDENAQTGSLDPNKHVGVYTFVMATDYTTSAKKDEYFTEGEITAKYPWLTVPEEKYKMPEALRRIVDNTSSLTPADRYTVTYVSTVTAGNEHPTLTLNVSNNTDDLSMAETSQFRVWLPNGQELGTGLKSTDLSAGGEFTVENWFDQNSKPAVDEGDGDDVDGSYDTTRKSADSTHFTFDLSTNPGDTTTNPADDEAAKREVLRRYINLGGWFYVAVNEDPANNLWSDPIPVYVPPRVNLYKEDKLYDFSGDNNGLFSWIFGTDLGATVTLPQGTYTAPTRNDAGELVTGEFEYGYITTYDGATGAEPGMNYTFTIQDGPPAAPNTAAWLKTVGSSVTGSSTTQYGANDFGNEATYTAYGTVNQPTDADGDGVDDAGTSATDHTVTILTDQTPKEAPTEGLVLKCITPNANVLYGTDGNVALATYDTQTVGYTVRQDYVFTLENTGTTDIYGIGIDTIIDGYMNNENDGGGGHFELLQAPATFLRGGETTTFILTYVYDLRANGSQPVTYRDTLHVTTAAHPEGVIHFDAQFQVAGTKIHKVTVVTIPSDGRLGTAGVIIGEVPDASSSTSVSMNYTPASTAYVEGEMVYVVVRPEDEYTPTVTVVDASGNTVPGESTDSTGGQIYTYGGLATLADGTRVYCFKMPDNDVTVTVEFREDLYSKLRLQNLLDYSGSGVIEGEAYPAGFRAKPGTYGGDLDETAHEDYDYGVWQKAFTTAELDYAAKLPDRATTDPTIDPSTVRDDDDKLYLVNMAHGKAGVYGFNSSVDLYMVVIPYEAEWSQVEATIRELKYHDLDGDGKTDNPDIEIRVEMAWFPDWSEATGIATSNRNMVPLTVVKDTGYTGGFETQADGTVKETGPSTHVSNVFESPEPGDSDYVRITLLAPDSDGITQSRHYYLEIHRADISYDQVLGYGNSPFGMIMNDSKLIDKTVPSDDPANLTEARRAAAKKAFIDAGYTFVGVGDEYVPEVVKDNKMNVFGSADPAGRAAVYWREAWTVNDSLYEPESGTGVGDPSIYFDDRAAAGLDTDPYGYFTNNPYRLYNLDLYEYTLFAILDQPLTDPGLISVKDSSGRPADVKQARVECTVTLLNPDGTTQVARFSGTDTETLSMGISGFKDTPYDQWAKTETGGVDADGKPITVPVTNIRPGRYVMEYVFLDYDGVTELRVTRPLVILAPLGDVNADLTVNNIGMAAAATETNDEYLVENRVTDPLGWFAGTAAYNSGSDMYPFANIFKYRVCDVNNDRNVNNIDANELEHDADTGSTYPIFYLPTGYAK